MVRNLINISIFTALFPLFCESLFQLNPRVKSYPLSGDAGQPLFLTPLIDAGKISEAQEECKMKDMKSNITSYSGFLTVDKRYNSNIFFVFFPSNVEDNKTAPLVLWLQGGPGSSSFYGVFNENGPFSVKRKHGLKLREHSWIKSHSVIYMDSPVGSGYSFTEDNAGYNTDEIGIASNLHSALIQFFTLFPQFQRNDFFITGESYAGKYVPAVSYMIHTKNPSSKLKINLKGMAIGNGFCDPQHMLNYGDYLYQIGLLDSKGKDLFRNKQREITNLVQLKKWKEAYTKLNNLIGVIGGRTSLLYSLTGFTLQFNFLFNHDYSTSGDMGRFLSHLEIRKNLHVGNVTFKEENPSVETYLAEDMMQSVKPWIETLLENYRVLLYNGQLDIIVPYPSTETFIDYLDWTGASQFRSASRNLWFVGDDLAGYVKTAKTLTFVLVRDAGHLVLLDQPKWGVDLITRFTRNKPFF